MRKGQEALERRLQDSDRNLDKVLRELEATDAERARLQREKADLVGEKKGEGGEMCAVDAGLDCVVAAGCGDMNVRAILVRSPSGNRHCL